MYYAIGAMAIICIAFFVGVIVYTNQLIENWSDPDDPRNWKGVRDYEEIQHDNQIGATLH